MLQRDERSKVGAKAELFQSYPGCVGLGLITAESDRIVDKLTREAYLEVAEARGLTNH